MRFTACECNLAALTLPGVVLRVALSPTHAPVSHRKFIEGPIDRRTVAWCRNTASCISAAYCSRHRMLASFSDIWLSKGSVNHRAVAVGTTLSMPLAPFSSGRTPPSEAQRTIITTCWCAPGLNRRPPAVLLETAGCSGPALADSVWIGASRRAHTAHAPIRE